MRVLVFGGTGALGAPVVRALLASGHQVVSASRSPRRTVAGATHAVADLLDADAVDRALAEHTPEAVVHAATALPPAGPTRWSHIATTNALRSEGTRLLVGAAVRHGVRRIVSQSFVGGYTPADDPTTRLDESATFGDATTGPRGLRNAVDALRAIEQHTLRGGIEGVALRLGFFYGDPDATAALHAVVRKRLPLPGGLPGVVSFVHVEDAAAAVVAAVERAPAGSVYNVATGDPISVGDYLRAVAHTIDAPTPFNVPMAIGRAVAGPVVEFSCKHRPLDASRIKADLGWAPAGPPLLPPR